MELSSVHLKGFHVGKLAGSSKAQQILCCPDSPILGANSTGMCTKRHVRNDYSNITCNREK